MKENRIRSMKQIVKMIDELVDEACIPGFPAYTLLKNSKAHIVSLFHLYENNLLSNETIGIKE